MFSDLKPNPDWTNEDVVKWVSAQIEATREPGKILPAWMVDAFKDAMEQKWKPEDVATLNVSETIGEIRDDLFNFDLIYFKVRQFYHYEGSIGLDRCCGLVRSKTQHSALSRSGSWPRALHSLQCLAYPQPQTVALLRKVLIQKIPLFSSKPVLQVSRRSYGSFMDLGTCLIDSISLQFLVDSKNG